MPPCSVTTQIPPIGERSPVAGPAAQLRWWVGLLVAVVAFLVYANSLPNRFAFDDSFIVETNPLVLDHEWTRIWSTGYWPPNNGPIDVLYRPLTIYTIAANDALTPGQLWPFHLTNVLLHALISALVVVLAFRLFQRQSVALLANPSNLIRVMPAEGA
jgi:protein O-mannosyl-transferase